MFDSVPVLPDFMGSNDGSYFIELTPAFGDVWAESETDALEVSGMLTDVI
jgi:hypothetical protein